VEAELIAHIAEVERRELYLKHAHSSMHGYCTGVLHLSDAEAYLRIAVARCSRRFPEVLAMLKEGKIHLSGLAKLDRHLTRQNAQALLKAATHRSKREIDALVATIAPKPDVPAKIRKLPDRKTSRELRPDGVELSHVEKMGTGPVESPSIEPESDSGMPIAPLPVPERAPAVLEPLSESRYKVQFTASRELCDKLERLQALASHSVRPGDLEALIDMAVTHEIQRLEKKRYAATERPRDKAVPAANTDQKSSPKQSRHIPAAVKRAVIARDGERCAFVDKAGSGQSV
jgi:hypothetical protein